MKKFGKKFSKKSFKCKLKVVFAFVEKQFMRKMGDGNSCVELILT